MSPQNSLADQITDTVAEEAICLPGEQMTLGEIRQRIQELQDAFSDLLQKAAEDPSADYTEQFRANTEELAALKQQRDMQIAISVRDIFWNRTANSYIVPTNTYFRTKMDNEYISPNSVQGRFQLKYFKRNIHSLDKLIKASLSIQGIKGESTSDCFGSITKYPIGTVAKIDHKGKHFYFVAINDVNEFGKPIGQSIENVNIALAAVTDAINRMGHYDTLCIPLLGSGKAAIQEATKENVFQRTVDYFIQSNDKLASKLIISVNPKDYLDGKIDLTRMEKYLDYKCEFGKMLPSMPCK